MAGYANAGGVNYGVDYPFKFDTAESRGTTPMIDYSGSTRSGTFNSNNPISLLEKQYNSEISGMPEGGFLGNITLPEMPRLNLSEYRPSRVRNIRQQVASPYLSKAGSAVSRAIATANAMGNTPAAQNAVREAIAGYGEGIGGIMAGAGREARGQYGEELGLENQGIMAQYQTDVARKNLETSIAIRNAEAKEAYRQKLMDRLAQISLLKQQILTNRENQDIAYKRTAGANIPSLAASSAALNDRLASFHAANPAGVKPTDYAAIERANEQNLARGTIAGTSGNVAGTGNEWDNIYKEFTGRAGKSLDTTGTGKLNNPGSIDYNAINNPPPTVTWEDTSTQIPSAISHTPSLIDLQRSNLDPRYKSYWYGGGY